MAQPGQAQGGRQNEGLFPGAGVSRVLPRVSTNTLASLIALATLKLGDRVRFNLNAGWSYARADTKQNAAFCGAQAELGVARDLTVMVEAFRRDGGKAGGQTGRRACAGILATDGSIST